MLKTTPVQRTSIQHEYCKTMSTAGERSLGGLPAGKISTVWELHMAEDRRRGRRRGEEDRAFQHCMPRSILPEPPSPVGTGISSAAAHSGNRCSRHCCCRGVLGTGVPGGVEKGVLAQPMPVLGGAMGTSISSGAAYAGQVLQGAVGTGGHGRARGQDWRSRCCVVRGDGAGSGWGRSFWPGWMLPGWDGGGWRWLWRLRRALASGASWEVGCMGVMSGWLARCGGGWPVMGPVGLRWGRLVGGGAGRHDTEGGEVGLSRGASACCGAGWCNTRHLGGTRGRWMGCGAGWMCREGPAEGSRPFGDTGPGRPSARPRPRRGPGRSALPWRRRPHPAKYFRPAT